MQIKRYFSCLFLIAVMGCSSPSSTTRDDSYILGGIGAFGEMVSADVKQLALSAPLPPEEMDKLWDKAQTVAANNQVELYRESEFLVTDLFPAEITEGKDVLLIYRGTTKDQYMALKADKARLEAEGAYQGRARESIARRFGRMLSYSPQKINSLLAQNTDFRTMSDFGIRASNLFLYYEDLPRATRFYSQTLGLELLADYGMATIFRAAATSYLILVDAAKGMHSADEPKTVAIALLTDQLSEWYDYLKSEEVQIKYPYRPRQNNPHDGFVAIDPEGYLLEFETFKQHPENERFIPLLSQNTPLFPSDAPAESKLAGLGIHATITWLYYKDVKAMEDFYQEVLGLRLVADQGWTKIYRVTDASYIGLVDERRGMHRATEEKGVSLSFILDDIDSWYEYVQKNQTFPLRSDKIEVGPEKKYRAFVGYDPEGYFMEFDVFYDHTDNTKLMNYLHGQ